MHQDPTNPRSASPIHRSKNITVWLRRLLPWAWVIPLACSSTTPGKPSGAGGDGGVAGMGGVGGMGGMGGTVMETDGGTAIAANTPAPFSAILASSYAPATALTPVDSLVTRERYLLSTSSSTSAPGNTYLAIDPAANTALGVTMPPAAASTYADYLQSLVQAVADAGQPPCFRFDSHINPNYSLDFEASTSALVFRNNWGAAPVAYGYVCFAYDGVNHTFQAIRRYTYDITTYTHALDNNFMAGGWYLHYEGGTFSLTSTVANATPMYVFKSPIDVSIPTDFNPKNIPYQPNAPVNIANWLKHSISMLEGPSNNGQFTQNLSPKYTPQVAVSGPDKDTLAASNAMLQTIATTLAAENQKLRYDISVYAAFRAGLLERSMLSDGTANGAYKHAVAPYVYFTNEADANGSHHPFMVIACYSVLERPHQLLDIHRPPGAPTPQAPMYPQQDVTRNETLQNYLVKIPMRDYGLVDKLTDNAMTPMQTLAGTAKMPTTDYTVWNYASVNESGVLIDGVVYFPAYNNTLVPAQQEAELTANGCHVGQGMGMHCHADGYTAQNNNFNLYNDADYVGQAHPPLIGFGFDGVAVYGAYTSSFPNMDGSTVALDEYGGHRHNAASPYHYHSQVMDPPVSAGMPYKLHALGNVGAWRGRIVDVPNFWNGDKVADTTGQSTIWVKGQ